MKSFMILCLALAVRPAFANPCADRGFIDDSYDRAIDFYITGHNEEALLQFKAIQRCDPDNLLVANAARRIGHELAFSTAALKKEAGGASPQSGAAAMISDGGKLFRAYNCRHCHSLNGSGGKIGPRLDDVFGAFSVAKIRRHLQNPKRDKKGSKMPNFGLRPDEVNALMAYLHKAHMTRQAP